MKPWCLGRTSVGENSDREDVTLSNWNPDAPKVYLDVVVVFLCFFLRIVPFVKHGIKPHHLGFVFYFFEAS